ncbi:1-acyl-sn-glycerol-3-phosphate acyltransferase, partial [Frankia sp. AgW1.1]|nr:1-acyl-sn-glycerol-3-phosphate acyltransferase [Frankia sp. AgW1.1]
LTAARPEEPPAQRSDDVTPTTATTPALVKETEPPAV